MSRSHSESLVRLEVRAASSATEIFVSDTSFRRIAKGVGSLDLDVPPGFYKVRFRVGNTQHDQLIEVSPSTEVVRIEGEPVQYETAAPLAETASSAPGDAERAAELSKRTHRSLGDGSRLMLLVRDLEQRTPKPWAGVSLLSLEGEHLADLSEGDCDEAACSGGLSLELPPGTYRLRVDTSPIGVYEMFVVASPGWQTQVFALAEDFSAGGESVRRAALRSISILMARPERGFDPETDELRLADLARMALATNREIVSKADQHALEHGKFDDPMLGIYAGHLLLLAPRPNHKLIDVITGNLRNLLGHHPDVEALELRSGASTSSGTDRFDAPPMLRSSWDLLVRATRRHVSLVSPGSVSDAIADDIVSSRPWLLHRVSERADSLETEEVPFAHGRWLLEQLAMQSDSSEVRERAKILTRDKEALSTLERSLLKAAIPLGRTSLPDSIYETDSDRPALAKETAARAIRLVDAPATSIARSAKTLLYKLDLDTKRSIS